MQRTTNSISFVPRTPAVMLPRERLVARLEAAIATTPVVIVRAHAGAGKTTALADWARTRRTAGVWVTLDRSAGDRLGFWKRVTAAIANSGHLGPHSLLHDFVVAPESAPAVASAMSRALEARDAPFILVLDDYQEVLDPAVHDDLHRLLRQRADLSVMIGTRVLSPLESAERRAGIDTTLLSADHLAFSRSEVEEIVGLFGRDPEVAEPLHREFAGWPLPTRTALLELAKGHMGVRDAIERVRRNDGGLVLDGMDEDYLEFLLRTSLATRISPDLARELGGESALAHLARAEREGIGSWTARESGEAFVVHAHLRQQLERELLARLPAEVADLRGMIALDRLAHQDPLEAARQYAAVGDTSGIAEVVRRHYGDLSWAALAGVLRTMRTADLRRQPELLAILVVADYADPGAPRARIVNTASLIIALAQARLGIGEPVERLSLLLGMLAAQRTSGHYEQAAAAAERLTAIAGGLDEDAHWRVSGVLPTVWSQSAASHFFEGNLVRAEELFRLAVEAAQQTDQSWREVYATGMLTLIFALRGDMGTARARLQAEQERRRPHSWAGTYMAAGHHLAKAFLALEDFNAGGVRDELDQLSDHELTMEHWPLLARLRALAALAEGRPALGLETLNRDLAAHAQRPPISRSMTAMLAATRADLLLASGQPERARAALKGARHDPGVLLARARIELALGHDHEAIAFAGPTAWSDDPNPRAKAEALLLLAVASARLHRADEATRSAKMAWSLIEGRGMRWPLLTLPGGELTAVLSSAGIQPDVLARVPDVFAQVARADALTPQEHRVLDALQEMSAIADLADRLHVSPNTVKSHLKQIYRKLDVRSRREALGAARLRGILREDETEPQADAS